MESKAQPCYEGNLDNFQVILKVTDSNVIIEAKNALDSKPY